MTMPTERSRASEAHRRYQASRDDSAMQEAARIQRAMSTDMPVMPTDEPVERQDWGPVVNWRSLAIGLVAIAVCVAVYVGMPA